MNIVYTDIALFPFSNPMSESFNLLIQCMQFMYLDHALKFKWNNFCKESRDDSTVFDWSPQMSKTCTFVKFVHKER